MSTNSSHLNKRARTVMLCGILIASGIAGALIPFSSIVGIDNGVEIEGPSEAEATTTSNPTEGSITNKKRNYANSTRCRT